MDHGSPLPSGEPVPEPMIPTQAEIRKLPHWAIVAFAARCARRVEPLTRSLRKHHHEAIVRAIEEAENAATASAADAASATAVSTAIRAAAEAASASSAADADADADARTADAAARTADAARTAIAAYACAYSASADAAASAASAVAHAASAVVDLISENNIRRFIAADFQRVADGASAGAWHANTPVSPEVFGPLWPEGEPDWAAVKSPAPTAASEREEPSFDLWIEPGSASTETIQEVLVALSRLHMAAGGHGLEFMPDGSFVGVREMDFA